MFRLLIALSIASVNVTAYAGKGSGAGGGGVSLDELFTEARQGSLYFLNDERRSGIEMDQYLGSNSCSMQDLAWLAQNRQPLAHILETHPLKWIDLQSQCALRIEGAITLDPLACRSRISNRADAIKELVLLMVPTPKTATCLTELVEQEYFFYILDHHSFGESLRYDQERHRDRDNLTIKSDRLRRLLNEARPILVKSLRNWDQAVIPENTDKVLLSWFQSSDSDGNKITDLLAQDIQNSQHKFSDESTSQSSCARTNFSVAAVITFAPSHCEIHSQHAALQVLAHEATHHAPFNIHDEILADRIAALVTTIIEANPESLYRSDGEIKQREQDEKAHFMILYNILRGATGSPDGGSR